MDIGDNNKSPNLSYFNENSNLIIDNKCLDSI